MANMYLQANLISDFVCKKLVGKNIPSLQETFPSIFKIEKSVSKQTMNNAVYLWREQFHEWAGRHKVNIQVEDNNDS